MSESKIGQEETPGEKKRFVLQTAVSHWIASGKKKPEDLWRICEILVASDGKFPELIEMIREGSGGGKD